ncbi:MAG: protein BmrU [Planctomycetaceae bacterium]|nr:protein BmrU [Planctomycetaceae bacterium]
MSRTISLPPEARRVLISQNPKAGAKSGNLAVEQLAQALAAQELQVDVLSDIDEIAERADEYLQEGELRCVVAAGGDGTIALVANRTPEQAPLTVLPLGTENLLAKHLSIGCDPAEVCRTICQGEAERFDAGRAGERLFLLMVGCGFDADVVRRLHADRTGHIHHLSYAKPILDSICNYEYPELTLECTIETEQMTESRVETISARWAFVANLPRYAGGLQIAPGASGHDGLLDVCTFKEGSLWNGLRYLSGVLLGQHESWEDCVATRATRVRIDAAGEAPYQLDGDPGGMLPVDIEVLPERLTLLVPATNETH